VLYVPHSIKSPASTAPRRATLKVEEFQPTSPKMKMSFRRAGRRYGRIVAADSADLAGLPDLLVSIMSSPARSRAAPWDIKASAEARTFYEHDRPPEVKRALRDRTEDRCISPGGSMGAGRKRCGNGAEHARMVWAAVGAG